MPPTYSPWSIPFEKLARFALGRKRPFLFEKGFTGPRDGADVMQGEDWRRYTEAPSLYELWGPPQTSPWSAFHRPTLFAAVDSIGSHQLWPSSPAGFAAGPPDLRPPAWMDRSSAIILDLPAAASVAWAALASRRGAHEPVATFNNWPHLKALVDVWPALGALLYYAPWQREGKENRRAAGDPAPPLLMLDRARLGARRPRPSDFDNRYYLLDSDLPTAAMLRRAGVERVVYVTPVEPHLRTAPPQPRSLLETVLETPPASAPPDHPEVDDMNRYLHELSKRIPVALARLPGSGWGEGADPVPWAPAIRKTPFNTVKDPTFAGFRRAAAGGFGELVPEPSSGGG